VVLFCASTAWRLILFLFLNIVQWAKPQNLVVIVIHLRQNLENCIYLAKHMDQWPAFVSKTVRLYSMMNHTQLATYL
jgi:hypothetical protein